MILPNKDLIDVITSKLINEFGKRGHHKGRGPMSPYDPWWWPVIPSNVVENWGLTSEQGARILEQWAPREWDLPPGRRNDVFSSLCHVPIRASRRTGTATIGVPDSTPFRGSLGATEKCIMVLGERPSFNRSFSAAASKLLKRIASIHVYSVPGNDCAAENQLLSAKAGEPGCLNVHVSDVVKFRGPTGRDGPGSNFELPLLFDAPDPERMITISVECLAEELRLLNPVMILRTDMARVAMKRIRQCYPGAIGSVFAEIDAHPGLVEVVHWTTDDGPANWPLRIRENLVNDSDVAERVRSSFELTL